MDRREQLRDFLRTRRARLSPGDVGLPDAGRRRTPGLRREEVAVLAGVGVSWYTWLEQGRDIRVSAQVLDAIGWALRLDAHERAYLHRLAGLNPPAPEAASPAAPGAELHRVLDAWLPRPAYILDRHWGLAATNAAAREIFGLGPEDHNCLVAFFTSRRYRAAFTHWEEAAPGIVARFRADAARHPDDPVFPRLVNELVSLSAEFARLWARHEVTEAAQGRKTITHPRGGELIFEYTALPLSDHPGHRVVLHNPLPGTDTSERLEALAEESRLIG
ncbi:helix-turn-helix transcriptional regulator [Streptomyces marincola]|uniref:helix-turn-helix transcriptional regulator n=1 Tax=Streptomyces marincola TaxID=2878388 RepID=UPI001CF3C348|nr:helix-turn-helix transcriptional regulator [Streptomyces marincola]UCM89345.1 helix-turn-helix transcriptional regulator [Streptomyces marincola]